MKTYILLAFLFIGTQISYAQSQYNPCYDPEWDWTIPENWKVYFPENLLPDGTYIGVTNYPFVDTEMNRDFRIILDNNDLSPDDGWVLLQKNLGCEVFATAKPYVIFYNYYRGLIRVFALHTYDESSTYGLMTVDWGGGNRSSALTYSNIYSRANDNYPSYNDDMVMQQIENYAKDQWWVGEFQVAFDHKTQSNQTGYYLDFSIYNVINSEIQFTSKVDLSTKSLEVKGEKSKKEGNTINNAREWTVKGQKAIQKLNYDEWDDYLEKTAEVVEEARNWAINKWIVNDTHEELMYKTWRLYNDLTMGDLDGTFADKVSKGADFLGKLNPILGAAVDLIDFFVGKPSKTSTPSITQLAPLQITGTINSSGEIKTTTQQYNYSLPLPGTIVDFPYFECPLGVLNLKETPNIELRKWKETKRKLSNFQKTSIKTHYNELEGWHSVCFCDENSYFDPCTSWEKINLYLYNQSSDSWIRDEKWKSIKLDENIQIAINSAANLELVEAKIAFQGKINRKSSNPNSAEYNIAAYDLYEKYDFLPSDFNENYKVLSSDKYDCFCNPWCGSTDIYYDLESSNVLKERWINKTFDFLKSKKYFLIEGGEDIGGGKRNEFYKFRTEFVDIKEAHNLSFTVREETDVTLKILAVFKEADSDNAPLMLFTNEYIIGEPENETDAVDSPYPFIRGQLTEVEIYEGSQDLTILKDQNISQGTFTNGKIQTAGNVNVNATGDVKFVANHSIVLGPGFSVNTSGTGSFVAKIENDEHTINTTSTSLNQIAKYYKDGVEYDYHIPCNCISQISNNKSATISKQKVILVENETVLNTFPNPCNDYLNIDYFTPLEGLSQLTITDLNGRIIIQKNISSGFQRINLSSFSKGIYLLRITNTGENITKKIVKH